MHDYALKGGAELDYRRYGDYKPGEDTDDAHDHIRALELDHGVVIKLRVACVHAVYRLAVDN